MELLSREAPADIGAAASSQDALADTHHRIVVSPAFGKFVHAAPMTFTAEGEWVSAGQVLGTLETGDGTIDVPSPCDGWLVDYLVLDGQRVRPGTALCHVEAE
ncbi:MAG TPA: lipoyl domain-containing protein [Actinomycetota bacterium]|nr:lipoyl domain-containing protein [Actinomycetota bacterium]